MDNGECPLTRPKMAAFAPAAGIAIPPPTLVSPAPDGEAQTVQAEPQQHARGRRGGGGVWGGGDARGEGGGAGGGVSQWASPEKKAAIDHPFGGKGKRFLPDPRAGPGAGPPRLGCPFLDRFKTWMTGTSPVTGVL